MDIIENAIKHLKDRNFTGHQLDIAIEALEKQEPFDVEEGTEGGFDWYCRCGTYLSHSKCEDIKYCINCGQKLKWD